MKRNKQGNIHPDQTTQEPHAQPSYNAEDKYRMLFDSIDEGFCIIEMIYNERGEAIDYRFLEVNRVFERHTGLHDVVGKTVSELAVGIEIYWIKEYEHVVRTGMPSRIENYHKGTDRWYLVSATRFGNENSNQLAVLLNDITERKKAEQALAENRELQTFMLKLSDALRDVTDPVKIQTIAARLLGEHLNVNQVHYGEKIGDIVVIHQSWSNGLSSMVGSFHILHFCERMVENYQAGHIQVTENIHTDPNITDQEREVISGAGFSAYIAVPLIKNGDWVATLAVHSIHPRKWRQLEIELVKETAQRTWDAVEMAVAESALRENEIWLKGQQQAFQAAMKGQSLTTSLQPLIDTIIAQTKGQARAAFYMIPVNKEGLHLIAGMNEAYAQDVNGFIVGPESLACGLAMHTGEPVITKDVEEEPLWKPFLKMAREHRYRGCWSFPVRTEGGPVLGTLAMYFEEPREPSMRELEMAGILAHSAAIIISRGTELRERMEAEDALRDAEMQTRLRQLEEAQQREIFRVSLQTLEEERQRMAESLHNGLGQVLYGVKISLAELNLQQQEEAFWKAKNYTSQLLTDAIKETRRISHDLMPTTLEEFGLKSAVYDICEQLRGSIRFTCNIDIIKGKRLEKYVELAVYRIVQELMTNVVKHADAQKASVSIDINNENILIKVTDDGIGFQAIRKGRSGIGLASIRSKLSLLSGSINVQSEPGKGTNVEINIPMPAVS